MLIGFSVSNFKSFKDTQSLSLKAGKVIRHKSHLIETNDKRLLKTALIFGANASGKSNLIKALSFSKEVILRGLSAPILRNDYFKNDKSMYKKPSVFQYELYLNNQEYSYGIALSFESRTILSEWLVEIDNKGNEKYIFNRYLDENSISHTETDFNDEEDATSLLKFYLDGFANDISDAYKTKTILSDIGYRTANAKGIFRSIKDVFDYFNNIVIINPNSPFTSLAIYQSPTPSLDFYNKVLKDLDTGIESIIVTDEELDFNNLLDNTPSYYLEEVKNALLSLKNGYSQLIKLNDRIVEIFRDEKGDIKYKKIMLKHAEESELFEFTDESDGIKRLFDLLPILSMKNKYYSVFIDEIDRSLHTSLLREVFKMFYSIKENKTQLIATTHDTALLDLDLFRQDEIWFIERKEDKSSHLYSLNKFKERFDKKVEKDYLLGRYGAVPVFDKTK